MLIFVWLLARCWPLRRIKFDNRLHIRPNFFRRGYLLSVGHKIHNCDDTRLSAPVCANSHSSASEVRRTDHQSYVSLARDLSIFAITARNHSIRSILSLSTELLEFFQQFG